MVYGPRAARCVRRDVEPNIFKPAQPNLVSEYFYHMTDLETNLLKALTHESVRFCSRPVRLFLALLAQMRTALIRDFHQWYCKGSARRAVRVK